MSIKKIPLFLLCVLLLSAVFGCSALGGTIDIGNHALENMCSDISEEIRSSKVSCTLNTEDATQIQYQGTKYQILNTQLSQKDDIGKWTGIILQFAALNSRNRVLAQRDISDEQLTNSSTLRDLENELPENAKWIVPFYDVYHIIGQKESNAVAVLTGRHFYKAIPVKNERPDDQPLQIEKEAVWENGGHMDLD